MAGSPTERDRHVHRARLVLAVGVCFGLGYLLYRTVLAPAGAGINFAVYRAAAADLWAGSQVYGTSPVGDPAFTFRYPPITFAWFSLYLLVSPLAGYLLHVGSALVVSALLGHVAVDTVDRYGVDVGLLDRVLVAGFVAVGAYAAPSLLYGNVNHHLALGVGLGVVWLARDQQTRAGVAFGLAALVKVFPAGIGVWLLWRRAWRAILAALATGLGGLALGVATLGPDRTLAFVRLELLSRAAPATAAGRILPGSEYVTIVRPLSVLVPGAGFVTWTLLGTLVLAPVLFVCYRDVSTDTDRLVAAFATLAVLLLVLPSFSLYFLVLAYPLAVLLYVLPSAPGTLFAAGAGLSLLTLKLPDLVTLVDAVPLPAAVGDAVLVVARAVYALGTPIFWGTLVMLGACVWHVRRSQTPYPAAAHTGETG